MGTWDAFLVFWRHRRFNGLVYIKRENLQETTVVAIRYTASQQILPASNSGRMNWFSWKTLFSAWKFGSLSVKKLGLNPQRTDFYQWEWHDFSSNEHKDWKKRRVSSIMWRYLFLDSKSKSRWHTPKIATNLASRICDWNLIKHQKLQIHSPTREGYTQHP